jgi:hypothetical protein
MMRTRLLAVGIGWCCGGALLSGCGAPDPAPGPRAEARAETLSARVQSLPPVVQRSIQAMGGTDGWATVRRIEGQCLLSLHDAAGAYTNRFAFRIQLDAHHGGGILKAGAPTPQGTLRVNVSRVGAVETPVYRSDPALQKKVAAAMRVILHRYMGPWNLASPSVASRETGIVRLVERNVRIPCIRVGVTGDVVGGAYYFDETDNLLRYVTEGADAPGAEGVLTRYSYVLSPCGLAVPQRIEIVEIGEYALAGEKKLIEADFSDVQFHSTPE